MYYINYKHPLTGIETIDEAETREEAYYLTTEYRIAFREGEISVSKKNYYER